MQSVDRFEERFTQGLRHELDSLEVRLPMPRLVRRSELSLRLYGLVPSLAVATAATIAILALAAAFTGSTNPTVWIKPAVWMRSLGIAPASPTPSPTTDADESASPEPGSKHESSPASEPPEREPGASPSGDAHESPEPSGDGEHRSTAPGSGEGAREPDD
jgi:hypothetical protein